MGSSPPAAFDPHEPLRHPRPVVGAAEVRTRGVVVLTLAAAIAEVTYGTVTHSMALVADGWHMATHVGALALTAAAYWYARTHATRDRFTFGPGKIYALAGFTNSVLLAFAAIWLGIESIERLVRPETIDFAQAIPVAVIGLVVNVASAALLHGGPGHDHAGHAHGHGHDAHGHGHDAHGHGHDAHGHGHDAHGHDHAGHAHGHGHDAHGHGHDAHGHGHDAHGHDHAGHAHGHGHDAPGQDGRATPARIAGKTRASALTNDQNLQAAYLHVLADALTSLLAIVALIVGRQLGFTALDPLMGVVGAVIIARWAWKLAAAAARPLLDMVPGDVDLAHLREVLEEASAGEVVDMHVWEMAPNENCCVVVLAAHRPVDLETCRRIVVRETAVDHLTVELRPCHRDHGKPLPGGGHAIEAPVPGPSGPPCAVGEPEATRGHRHR